MTPLALFGSNWRPLLVQGENTELAEWLAVAMAVPVDSVTGVRSVSFSLSHLALSDKQVQIARRHWREWIRPRVTEVVLGLAMMHVTRLENGAAMCEPIAMEAILQIVHAVVPLSRLLPKLRHLTTCIVNLARLSQ
jgi:hypothetical protein